MYNEGNNNKQEHQKVIKKTKTTGTDLQQTSVIYKFPCPLLHKDVTHTNKYIRMTTTTLSRRLIHRLQKASIKKHYQYNHQQIITNQR